MSFLTIRGRRFDPGGWLQKICHLHKINTPRPELGSIRSYRLGDSVSGSDNLNADSFRIRDMKSRIKVVFRICAALFQFPCH
jgi:hypothetical protein